MRLPTSEEQPPEPYCYPSLNLFNATRPDDEAGAAREMKKNADILVNTLDSFGVKTTMLDICRGPSVTRYELQPQAGIKVSRITSLADDIALNLATAGVRIEAPIPGKPAVGIEVPNKIRSTVNIRAVFESQNYINMRSPLTMALGKDIAGTAQVADLCKMPHLLIAGSTGSGKSVCVNSIIISFLFRSGPEDVKLILIDPKVVELAEYNGIPHLLMPVVTEPRKAAGALGASVAEMERRYKLFAENNVREIKAYNKLAAQTGMEHLPYIAIVIDELADLMMVAGKEVEDYICRIAQKARAAGIHLIVATQRPSVDVITGLIKANIPSRIAFAVSSQIDSRTILDSGGAEKLLGNGDMLFLPVGASKPVRVQGTFVTDEEIGAVLSFIKSTSTAQYDEEMIAEMERRAVAEKGSKKGGDDDGNGGGALDAMFEQAVECVIEAGQASTSLLQRRCKLGYARAARIMDQMEQEVEHEKEARADYYSKIEAIKQQLQKAYVIQNTAKMNAEQVKAKKADAKAVSSKIHEEGAELEQQIREIRENHESIQVELETSEKLEQELTEQIASYQKELDQERERESKQLLESEKVHLAYAAMEQKYQFLLENEQRIQEEITKFNVELSALRANKGDTSEEIQKKETQIEDIRLTIANSKELFEEIQKEIASYSSQKEELTQKHKAFLYKSFSYFVH